MTSPANFLGPGFVRPKLHCCLHSRDQSSRSHDPLLLAWSSRVQSPDLRLLQGSAGSAGFPADACASQLLPKHWHCVSASCISNAWQGTCEHVRPASPRKPRSFAAVAWPGFLKSGGDVSGLQARAEGSRAGGDVSSSSSWSSLSARIR